MARYHLPQPTLPILGGAPTSAQTYIFAQTAQPDVLRYTALSGPIYQPRVPLRSEGASAAPIDTYPYFIGQPLMKIRYVIPQNRTWVHGLTAPVVQTQVYTVSQPTAAHFALLGFSRFIVEARKWWDFISAILPLGPADHCDTFFVNADTGFSVSVDQGLSVSAEMTTFTVNADPAGFIVPGCN